jgi:hypothetical protein
VPLWAYAEYLPPACRISANDPWEGASVWQLAERPGRGADGEGAQIWATTEAAQLTSESISSLGKLVASPAPTRARA